MPYQVRHLAVDTKQPAFKVQDTRTSEKRMLLVLLLAGGSGKFKTGRHVRYNEGAPVSSLYLSILDAAGVPTERFGDSQGRLDYLSSLT